MSQFVGLSGSVLGLLFGYICLSLLTDGWFMLCIAWLWGNQNQNNSNKIQMLHKLSAHSRLIANKRQANMHVWVGNESTMILAITMSTGSTTVVHSCPPVSHTGITHHHRSWLIITSRMQNWGPSNQRSRRNRSWVSSLCQDSMTKVGNNQFQCRKACSIRLTKGQFLFYKTAYIPHR